MGTLFRFRRKHHPDQPDVLSTPSASLLDSHDDSDNEGGEHEAGGFHLI